jgi:cold shock protein
MPQGKVKWFDERKGYGFIATDEGKDIFVHSNSLKSTGIRALHEGETVSFDIRQDQKGPCAENIRVL